MRFMPQIRVKDAAAYLGVSDDTLRRWIENGALSRGRDAAGRTGVDGRELAELHCLGLVPRGVLGDHLAVQADFRGIVGRDGEDAALDVGRDGEGPAEISGLVLGSRGAPDPFGRLGGEAKDGREKTEQEERAQGHGEVLVETKVS